MLHVLGLPSGKDMQKPAPFLPANSKWSAPIAVGTMLYAATSGGCGSAPNAVWAIDLDSDAKAVTSWNTKWRESPSVQLPSLLDGTLIAAIGPPASGDGKSNAMVARSADAAVKGDWFTHGTAEFVTGPTIFRRAREIVAAATKDGRVVLLNADSLGGPDHATPLALSRSWLGPGATVSADALAAWQHSDATLGPNPATGTTS